MHHHGGVSVEVWQLLRTKKSRIMGLKPNKCKLYYYTETVYSACSD